MEALGLLQRRFSFKSDNSIKKTPAYRIYCGDMDYDS